MGRGGCSAIEAIENLEAKLRIVEPTFAAEGTWQMDLKVEFRGWILHRAS